MHALRGILLKVLATLAFAGLNATIKLLHEFPIGEIVFFRSFFALFPVLGVALYTGGIRRALYTERPQLHIARSLMGAMGMYCYFTSITLLPLADATAIGFVMPIFAVVLAAIFLKEQVGPYRTGAVIAGFVGVLVMVEPHAEIGGEGVGGAQTMGAAIGLFGSFVAAFVVIFIRQMSATETSEAIVFYFMTTCSVLAAVTMLFWFKTPGLAELALLILSGILGGIGQIAMTYSYRYAEPSLLAPFDYAAMVWAVILGVLIFAEVPLPQVLIGTVIVMAAGIFIAWRERQRGVSAPKPPSV